MKGRTRSEKKKRELSRKKERIKEQGRRVEGPITTGKKREQATRIQVRGPPSEKSVKEFWKGEIKGNKEGRSSLGVPGLSEKVSDVPYNGGKRRTGEAITGAIKGCRGVKLMRDSPRTLRTPRGQVSY